MNKKIKLLVLVCIVVLIIGSLSGFTALEETYTEFGPQCEKLSELSDQGIYEFLRYYQVDLPEEFIEAHTETELAQFVRIWVECVEEEQKMPMILYNYTVMHDVTAAICVAALKHYGWGAQK